MFQVCGFVAYCVVGASCSWDLHAHLKCQGWFRLSLAPIVSVLVGVEVWVRVRGLEPLDLCSVILYGWISSKALARWTSKLDCALWGALDCALWGALDCALWGALELYLDKSSYGWVS
jgi:hypothetical protein